ncbi:helix-turn-helix domain-containing protein [Paraglaciecola sp. L3A3]|uniref:helix-turn-helix domain-containing protein n=1 Tax=Paraglaciecola sp. L3A3 TaxID=2686358 RepID=UPI0018EEEB30|nr:helix-turn-helix domain-containing protein [Paraglaciecola sp. L3A3]
MNRHTLNNQAPLWNTIHANDANHQAANLTNWQQEFDQLSSGHFLGVINELHFSHIHTFREDTSHSLRQQCKVEQGGLWLGLSANSKSCRINNEQSTSNQFLCRAGGQDFELLTPDNFSIYGLVLHRSFFTDIIEQAMGDFYVNHSLWLENITQAELQKFRQYLNLLLQPKSNRWSISTHESILQDAVLELLSNGQQTAEVQVTSPQRQRIMARVHEYLTESRLKTPITMSEICAAVHVSRRTLQYTFTQCYGISPKQYIQVTRLNQVRRVLLNNEEFLTISEIAFNYGFFHLGWFCQNYKRLFGETPRQTLQHKSY